MLKVPDKVSRRLYYSISDVCKMADLKPHVLRYWESEFPDLRPRKNRAGNRAYKTKDIKLIFLIKHLLYEEKYTVEGARRKLRNMRQEKSKELELPYKYEQLKNALLSLKSELKEILATLDGRS